MPVPETPFTRAKNIGTARQIFGTVMTILRHGTPNFRRVTVSVPNVILKVPGLPPGGSLGTGKGGTVPKIWLAVPIVLASVNGLRVCRLTFYRT